jgi:hypothetical protein
LWRRIERCLIGRSAGPLGAFKANRLHDDACFDHWSQCYGCRGDKRPLVGTEYVKAIAEAMYGSAHGCRGDNGRRLPHRTIVEATNLVDCHSVCERTSRSYVSARAEICQRGTVEHSCRAAWLLNAKVIEAARIAVEQRGF